MGAAWAAHGLFTPLPQQQEPMCNFRLNLVWQLSLLESSSEVFSSPNLCTRSELCAREAARAERARFLCTCSNLSGCANVLHFASQRRLGVGERVSGARDVRRDAVHGGPAARAVAHRPRAPRRPRRRHASSSSVSGGCRHRRGPLRNFFTGREKGYLRAR